MHLEVPIAVVAGDGHLSSDRGHVGLEEVVEGNPSVSQDRQEGRSDHLHRRLEEERAGMDRGELKEEVHDVVDHLLGEVVVLEEEVADQEEEDEKQDAREEDRGIDLVSLEGKQGIEEGKEQKDETADGKVRAA